jgi:exosome complex component CSL4
MRTLVVPGLRLCESDDKHVSGTGTYSMHGYIYSSQVGELRLIHTQNNTVSVEVEGCGQKTVVPSTGDIVTVKILSVNPRFAKAHIMCVKDVVLSEPFRGQVRKEDVRSVEKDRVEMYKSFRPGDIVLARVISFGDAGAGYLLTTGENELGVVIARSEIGASMVPVSWTEMQCPDTYIKEFRKVAKVIPDHLASIPDQ